ncbi:HutD family protein [Scandinavium sp.]|uniref:HutD/Ves family protein n=1 Tax=Scandinavium sp. TaxID=2830653 RepID=UPI002896A4D4|nr:HutD family protein [Scandinavium sp.]
MIFPFSFDTLPVSRWKNGGGETREIIKVPSPDAPFLWRASLATLNADGPFSLFEGVDRVIMLLEGGPLWLRGNEINHQLERWQPWAFAGEWPLRSEGIAGAGLDFNIMTRRGRASASVQVVSSAHPPAQEGVAFVLQGTWELAGKQCHTRSGIAWQGDCPGIVLPCSDDALLLLAEISIL